MKVLAIQAPDGRTMEEYAAINGWITAHLKRILPKCKVLREPYDGAVDLIESAVVSSYNESLRDLAGMLLCVSSADLVVLTNGCLNYKACEIIHSCCEHYRVPVMEIRL